MKKLVFITGNYGQIGKTLTRLYKQDDVDFVHEFAPDIMYASKWYDRRTTHLKDMYEHDPEYNPELDVTDEKTMEMCIKFMVSKCAEYDRLEIWHTAAHVGADKCKLNYDATYNVNVRSVDNLIKAVNKHDYFGVHPEAVFINFTSTSLLRPKMHKMYQELEVDDQMNGLTGLFDENTPRDPQAWYGHTKLMAESMFKAAFQGNDKAFNIAPVMGCGVYPDDNASDMRKFASVVMKYLNEMSQAQPMVCNQNYEFFKAYVDIEVVMNEMINYVDEYVKFKIQPSIPLNHQVHEAVFAGTKVQRFGDILFDITLEMISQFRYKKPFDEINEHPDGEAAMTEAQTTHMEIVNNPELFVNNPKNDYLGCHLPEFNFILHLADAKYDNRINRTMQDLTEINPNISHWQPKLVEIHNEEPDHFELVKKLVRSHLEVKCE